jgi:hypothetical protein
MKISLIALIATSMLLTSCGERPAGVVTVTRFVSEKEMMAAEKAAQSEK